jgi:hypothetical protein
MNRALIALCAIALAGCGEEAGSELASRECLWVASAAKQPARFDGTVVAVCGWIDLVGDTPWLTDAQKPQERIALSFPPTDGGDAGLARLLARRDDGYRWSDRSAVEGRFHGRIATTSGRPATLRVERVDWLDGRPGGATADAR